MIKTDCKEFKNCDLLSRCGLLGTFLWSLRIKFFFLRLEYYFLNFNFIFLIRDFIKKKGELLKELQTDII